MKRRTFIKGAVAAAVSAALPGGDPFYGTANSDINQLSYVHKTFKVAYPEGTRYAAALARSMMQTKEAVAANVFNSAFSRGIIDVRVDNP